MDQESFKRFIDKIYFTDYCWLWTAGINKDGYGKFNLKGSKTDKAHRISYEFFVCLIPQGLTIDHLCLMKHCVNPDHLQLLSKVANSRRHWNSSDIECRNGHIRMYNTVVDSKGHLRCILCNRENDKKRSPRNLRSNK